MNHAVLSLLYGFGGTDPKFRFHRFFSFEDGIVASSTQTQAGARQLVADYNIVGTVTVDNDAVRLPPSSERALISVQNLGSPSNKDLAVYPYYGEDIGQGVDTAKVLPSRTSARFYGTAAGTFQPLDAGFVTGPPTSTLGAIATYEDTTGTVINSAGSVINVTGMGVRTLSPNAALEVAEQFSTANAAYPTARLFYRSTGTSQDGIGPRLEFATRSDGIVDTIVVGTIDGIAIDVSDGSEDGAIVIGTMKNAVASTEDMRVSLAAVDLSRPLKCQQGAHFGPPAVIPIVANAATIDLAANNHPDVDLDDASAGVTLTYDAPNGNASGTISILQDTPSRDITFAKGSGVTTLKILGVEPTWTDDSPATYRVFSWRFIALPRILLLIFSPSETVTI